MVIVGLCCTYCRILYILTGRRSWNGFRYFIERLCAHHTGDFRQNIVIVWCYNADIALYNRGRRSWNGFHALVAFFLGGGG